MVKTTGIQLVYKLKAKKHKIEKRYIIYSCNFGENPHAPAPHGRNPGDKLATAAKITRTTR